MLYLSCAIAQFTQILADHAFEVNLCGTGCTGLASVSSMLINNSPSNCNFPSVIILNQTTIFVFVWGYVYNTHKSVTTPVPCHLIAVTCSVCIIRIYRQARMSKRKISNFFSKHRKNTINLHVCESEHSNLSVKVIIITYLFQTRVNINHNEMINNPGWIIW